MSINTIGVQRAWPVGLFRCIGTVMRDAPDAPLMFDVRWLPRRPRSMTDAQLDAYTQGRARALRELEDELGVRLLLRPVV